jgi:hypothetical protein
MDALLLLQLDVCYTYLLLPFFIQPMLDAPQTPVMDFSALP